MPEATAYQTHGPLPAGSPLYVRRRADGDLLEGVRAGDFCYVLAPRQVGKSSLRYHVTADLQRAGTFVASANVQAATDAKTEAEWYEGVIDQLASSAVALNAGFTLPFDWGAWWDKERGPLAQRFAKLLKELFLLPTDRSWAITIDEIDASISLPFTDSFFAAVRLCFDQRPEQPAYRRLSIVLLGAATPTELIKDRSRTPFNIGRRIEMTDFTAEEAQPLAAPLPVAEPLKDDVLARVLYWTGGQPHLTQLVCEKLRELWHARLPPKEEAAVTAAVDRCVEALFFHGGILGDAHFAYITKRARDFPRARQLLAAYRRARSPDGLTDDQRSTVGAELKIAGLVKPVGKGTLRVANPIYERVFDDKWIHETIPTNWPAAITGAGMSIAMLTIVVGYFTFNPARYINQLEKAVLDLPQEPYDRLRAIPGYRDRADELFAKFWDRHAQHAQVERDLDRALIYGIRAANTHPTKGRWEKVALILNDGYGSLRTVFRAEDRTKEIFTTAFSDDGRTLLTGSGSQAVMLWDAQRGEPKKRVMQDGRGTIDGGASGLGYNIVLTGCSDTAVRLWATSAERPKKEPSLPRPMPYTIAFDPSGNTMITGDGGTRAWLVDVESGQPKGEAIDHGSTIHAVAFSPDGNTVVTAGRQHARSWDVAAIEGRNEHVTTDDLAGTGGALLERWLERTALKFDSNGVALVNRHSLPPSPPEKGK